MLPLGFNVLHRVRHGDKARLVNRARALAGRLDYPGQTGPISCTHVSTRYYIHPFIF